MRTPRFHGPGVASVDRVPSNTLAGESPHRSARLSTEVRAQANQQFAKVMRLLGRYTGVSGPVRAMGGSRRFGSKSLRFRGRVFALLYYRGTLVVKLPSSRVDELVASGEGARWDPSRRGPFREWLELDPVSAHDWTTLAKEGLEYARSLPSTDGMGHASTNTENARPASFSKDLY